MLVCVSLELLLDDSMRAFLKKICPYSLRAKLFEILIGKAKVKANITIILPRVEV